MKGGYRRGPFRVSIVIVGNALGMISTLLLVLDNFSLVQRCFMTVSLKHPNSLKILIFLFDMDTSWPCDMLSLYCSGG